MVKTGRRACGASHIRQAGGLISTARLNVLPRVYLPPIKLVVFQQTLLGILISERASRLDAFSGLSLPHIATLRCGGRHNRCTSGASTPVLSY